MDKPALEILNLKVKKDRNISPLYLEQLEYSLNAGKYRIYKDVYNQVRACVLWADVNRETLIGILKYRRFPSKFYEWDEGKYSYILDYLTVEENDRFVPKYLVKELRKWPSIVYIRKNKVHFYQQGKGKLIKNINWLGEEDFEYL
ncbi:hypothetical protein PN836_011355 [Ningiella sp. W23]|uniref:hypothetical protein n=1 Tax=Ningiella sp. W23 TaxID=3023715 RepID=UPI003756BF70